MPGLKIKNFALFLIFAYTGTCYNLPDFIFGKTLSFRPEKGEIIGIAENEPNALGSGLMMKLTRPPGVSRINFRLTEFSQPKSTERKLFSYRLTNELHFNLPQIQNKFPLSEHTEEG